MPVAKGAGYVLSSVNHKKKLRKQESLSSANLDSQSVREKDTSTKSEAKRKRRRPRGCRHCRRHHDITQLPLQCGVNTCIKCIGCDKVLMANITDLNGYPPRLTVQSCCVDLRGKFSKVSYFVVFLKLIIHFMPK